VAILSVRDFLPAHSNHSSWSAAFMNFKKRTYRSLGELLTDLWFPFRNRKRLKPMRNENLISPALRERLMVAVTAVERWRYCSYVHAKQALKSGVSSNEISLLLSGDVGNCPEQEATALLYAQHMAESDGHPAPEAERQLRQMYGAEKMEAIHLMLRMIRLGNLLWATPGTTYCTASPSVSGKDRAVHSEAVRANNSQIGSLPLNMATLFERSR